MNATVLALCVGRSREIAPGVSSSIEKYAVDGPIVISTLGLAGDTQTDRKNHGGEHMAVHHYAADHYGPWRAELPATDRLIRPGAFGENLHALGLTEEQVHIGDRFRLGNALLEVSMGRQPCFKLDAVFGPYEMVKRIIGNGRCGWYYRVIEEGSAMPGDPLELVDRSQGEWTVARTFAALFSPVWKASRAELLDLMAIPALSPKWRDKVARKLD